MRRLTRFRIAAGVTALALVAGVAIAGIKSNGINQFPGPPDFVRRTQLIHLSGWAVTGDRAKAVYFTNRMGGLVATNVSAVVRAMSGTISAFTVQMTKNDLAILSSAIDMYGTGLASVGTYRSGTLIADPTTFKDGDEIGVDIVFTGTDTPTATDLDIIFEYRPYVGLEY